MSKRISGWIAVGGEDEKGDRSPFIIAEAGINHNGNIELAKKMVSAAKEAGADAVKFQTFKAAEFVQDREATYSYRSQGVEITESMLEMFQRNELTPSEWKELKAFCDREDILFLSTPQNYSDLELLLEIGIDAIKVGSDDFTNLPLIESYARHRLPMLLSCGMASEEEINETIEAVRRNSDKKMVLFLCTSEYPTPPEDVNALKLLSITEKFPTVVPGFSDHTQGSTAAVIATALGARVFEKHFTLSHDFPGPDHWFSSEPEELKDWVSSIRTAYKMLGSRKLAPTKQELAMRDLARRSITTLRNISAGELLSEENLCLRRPGTGIPAAKWSRVIGKRASRSLEAGIQITQEDIMEGPDEDPGLI